MVRAYLMILFVIGVTASMLSRAPSAPAADERRDARILDTSGASTGAAPAQPQMVANLQEGGIELQRNPNGHFYADVQINSQPIHMLIDTGASGIALSRDDARASGIP